MLKLINAKWNSRCAETGSPIKKGERMVYDYSAKKCYSESSEKGKAFINSPADADGAAMVQANEEAYFDSFCQNNNL